ncbi:DUF3718 domain-containing protein [Thalassotalea aquiviva]|uniref:DUF3718 domain-containing protein n=1 Tax=Thalassotalea aquiviva TaxID=3242415 RepID=UPI00352B2420
MKKLMLIGLALSVPFVANAHSSSAKLTAGDNSLATNLCMAALQGNSALMSNEIRSSGFSRKYVSQNISCNGLSLYEFAQTYADNPEALARSLYQPKTEISITDL